MAVIVHVHGERDGFTSAALRVAPQRRALPPHPCHGVTAVVAHYQLGRGDGHSTQCRRLSPVGAAGTAALSPRGGTIILECGSCALILSTAALAPATPCRFRHACIMCSQDHSLMQHVPCCECREGNMNPL